MPNPIPMMHPNFDFKNADTQSINKVNQETLHILQRIKPAANGITDAVFNLAKKLEAEIDRVEGNDDIASLVLLKHHHNVLREYFETALDVAESASRKIRDYEEMLGENRSFFAKVSPRWFRSIDFDHKSVEIISESNKLHTSAATVDQVVQALNELGVRTNNPVTPLLRDLPLVTHLQNQ